MPTNNKTGKSRRLVNEWPEPTEIGCVYTLCFARRLGNGNPRGQAQHYTGFSTRLAERLMEHWDATCGVRLVVAFRRAGIPFAVVAIERGVTRARENQLKLRGAAWRCPICKGRTAAAKLLTEDKGENTWQSSRTSRARSTNGWPPTARSEPQLISATA
jgi:hypothetical protein